ncbi:CcoQ/FixQ family Cbb3-type cytochrome c oxidase assembly chaperone [Spongiibacter sp. KMU-158]|uniref:CcoQ/FixQ family Cbb3-type cytochrome c oxidase assembly chaperone n=1 Tax=Spongiibacter pelagi TaxID=2760804 RepID=A0A927GWA0_9GAMM|nr:CcoQ/FixQ family Cbb3-type cytochrome c oxidase assembly chaperone [Spongiibacter pelagi]MBD2858214.1 CcoQ/FixQ family Cbb3-type cytochrome c oxidase assembly chaperone [Spongiibacter pelagi]
MEQDSLRALSTLLIFLAFIGLTFKVYRRSSSEYDDAANLPFADENRPHSGKHARNGEHND